MVPGPPCPIPTSIISRNSRLNRGIARHHLYPQFKRRNEGEELQCNGSNHLIRKDTGAAFTDLGDPHPWSLGIPRWQSKQTPVNKRKVFATKVVHEIPTTVHYSHINNNKGVRLPDKKLISFRAQLGMPLCSHLGPLAQAVGFMESRDESLPGKAAGPALPCQSLQPGHPKY